MHKEYQGVWCNSSKEFLNSKNLNFAIFANFGICVYFIHISRILSADGMCAPSAHAKV